MVTTLPEDVAYVRLALKESWLDSWNQSKGGEGGGSDVISAAANIGMKLGCSAWVRPLIFLVNFPVDEQVPARDS